MSRFQEKWDEEVLLNSKQKFYSRWQNIFLKKEKYNLFENSENN